MVQRVRRIPPPSSFNKFARRFRRVTRNLIGASIYYGLMLNIGMVQSKAVFCQLCQTVLKGLKASEFWILFGALSFIFMLLNCLIIELARRLFTKSPSKGSQFLLYPNYLEPKYTRSGAIYGYRPA